MDQDPTRKSNEKDFDTSEEKQKLFWVSVDFLFDFNKQLEITDVAHQEDLFGIARSWQVQTKDVPDPEDLKNLGVDTIDFMYRPESHGETISYPETIDIRINDFSDDDSRKHFLLKIINPGLDEQVDAVRRDIDADENEQAKPADHEDLLYLDAVLFALRHGYPRPLATP